MKVITLNGHGFSMSVKKLVDKVSYSPDLIVGVLTGGGYLLEVIKDYDFAPDAAILPIKLQRSNTKKKQHFLVGYALSILPYFVLNFLRKVESWKVKQSLKNISGLNEIVEFNLNEEILEWNVNSILIVDDAIDTGKTALRIKNSLLNKFGSDVKIEIAVISWTLDKGMVEPDYYIYKNSLVRFPWSEDYKGKDFEKKSFSS